MTGWRPNHSEEPGSIAIIGDGVGALITFAILRHAGVTAEVMSVYGDSLDPLARLADRARSVRQERMRSESNGHLAPVDFPGLALVEAWQRRSIWPLLGSLFDAYTPPLDLLLSQGASLGMHTGFCHRRVMARVTDIKREANPSGLRLLDTTGHDLGTAQHAILAIGHPALAWPAATAGWCDDHRVCHAYQSPKFETGEKIVVIGGGLAAAHMWLAALRAGAHVTALTRRPWRRQKLNAPREAFSREGIIAYQTLDQAGRQAYLQSLARGSFPVNAHWERQFWRAKRQGRLTPSVGEVVQIRDSAGAGPGDNSLWLDLTGGHTLAADRLICATGFQPEAAMHPLVRHLIAQHQLGTQGPRLFVADDFTLPPLSRADSIVAVVGSLARWALPIADTFAGMKYAARRIAPLLFTDSASGH